MWKKTAKKLINDYKELKDIERLENVKTLIDLEMFLSKTEKNRNEWLDIYNLCDNIIKQIKEEK